MNITDIRHPDYRNCSANWEKWRLTYEGGTNFIEQYLKKFSVRETDVDYADRKSITYCPSFAKAAVNDIKNAIFQRMADVARVEGPQSYMDAIQGVNGGVDRRSSTMNSFIGVKVLPELLTMKRVGVFVDMPRNVGITVKDKGNKRPYIYMYKTEDILSWAFDDPDKPTQLTQILLRDWDYMLSPETGLPNGITERYRHLKVTPEGNVTAQFYDHLGVTAETVELGIRQIPFVMYELPYSLLEDVADHQIALLNLESADVNYARKANFPFYVEQFDPRVNMPFFKPPVGNDGDPEVPQATQDVAKRSTDPSVNTGGVQGRRYPLGADAPQFIHPSSEPLKAAMEKEDAIKRDIRLLINLAVAQLSAKMASAESKDRDNQGLEAGLSYIGLVLEQGEREIANLWSMYEGTKQVATIAYPKNYNLKSEEDRQAEADAKSKMMLRIPSNTFQHEIGKQVAYVLLSNKVSQQTMSAIYKEIDAAPTMTSDPKVIAEDWKNGFVSTETASQSRGYPKGEVEAAKKDHAERIARVKEAQGGMNASDGQARGDMDAQMDGMDTSSGEKAGKPKRGEQALPTEDE